MQAACDLSFEYAHMRKAFGQPIGKFQVFELNQLAFKCQSSISICFWLKLLQGKMADMYTTLNACRSYLYTTAKATDAGFVSSKVYQGFLIYVFTAIMTWTIHSK
jgi:isovaleryl-CoA dehydrogenase